MIQMLISNCITRIEDKNRVIHYDSIVMTSYRQTKRDKFGKRGAIYNNMEIL